MKYWNNTITLYNRHEDKQFNFIKWERHILTECFVKRTNNKMNVGGEQLIIDDTVIRIPKQYNYKEPYEWVNLSSDIMSDYITLQPGDLIFLGRVMDDIDEYTAGQRSSDLIAKYSAMGSVAINSVNININLPNPHYYVKGK